MVIKINKQGQVTVFIIIAIVIVAAIILFFTLSKPITTDKIPASIDPVYTTLLSCLEEDTLVGVSILQTQAGYIDVPEFEPGSSYMPFSSQLDFLGNPVPYWYYVSGNNIQKEQIPSKANMEQELADFVESEINTCIFDKYYEDGFEIRFGEPEANVKIKDTEIEVGLDMDFNVNFAEDSARVSQHNVVVDSRLGKLYDSAVEVYEKEQEELFLEEYAVDTLTLYAPVDGVELSCSPVTWATEEVFDELEIAIEANTLALKSKGSNKDYFVVDLGVDEDVRFINSRNWPRGFEVSPSEGNILISSPVGNQAGLGIMGFCYVPYHFVYNVRYPVLIQIQEGDEIFQFPVAIVLQGNQPRQALDASAVALGIPDLCEYKNNIMEIEVYDTNVRPIDAQISFECSGTKCDIGETTSGSLSGEFPQCVNGQVLARAEGYEDGRKVVSEINGGSVSLFLERLYDVEIELELDGSAYGKDAIISFISEGKARTIVYPEQTQVELSEGDYEVQVHIYDSSSLRIDKSVSKQCVEVPRSGLGGLFGLTKEECFEVEIPAQVISNALAGGGKQGYYFVQSELNSRAIVINAESLPAPNSLEQLQDNYLLFEDKSLEISFK